MDITLISCPNCGIRNRLRAGQDPRTLNCGQCDNPLVIEEAPERLLVICPECDTDWEVDAPGWVECPECGHWFEIDEYGEPVDVEDSQDLATEQASRLDDEESDWESEGFTSEGTTEEEQLIRLADYPALLEVANPDLYRCNAYNVLSILPSSDQSEIQRRIRQIEIRQKLGAAGEDTRIIQLKSQPTLEQIRGAKQRLEDPDRRFIDEFFWLWPNGLVCNGGNSHLPIIIRNLKQQTRRSEDDYVALHNLAVLSHAIALELERSDQLPDAVKVQLGDADSYWSDAFDSWARLLEDERFWRHVEDRVIEIDDPRLTVEKVGQLRAFLPVAIISINGQLTMQAIEGGCLKT